MQLRKLPLPNHGLARSPRRSEHVQVGSSLSSDRLHSCELRGEFSKASSNVVEAASRSFERRRAKLPGCFDGTSHAPCRLVGSSRLPFR
jgi:hypothetical protein